MAKVTKTILVSVAVVVGLAGLVVSNISLRNKGGPEAESSASTEQQQDASASDIPACDDDNAKQSVGTTLASSGIQLLDIGNVKELNFDSANHIRYCEADIAVSNGQTHISYKIFQGPSGKLLVEAKEGTDAFNAFGLSTEAYSQKQYDAKVQALKGAVKEYKDEHPASPPAQPDYMKAPGAVPFGTPYHSNSSSSNQSDGQQTEDQPHGTQDGSSDPQK